MFVKCRMQKCSLSLLVLLWCTIQPANADSSEQQVDASDEDLDELIDVYRRASLRPFFINQRASLRPFTGKRASLRPFGKRASLRPFGKRASLRPVNYAGK